MKKQQQKKKEEKISFFSSVFPFRNRENKIQCTIAIVNSHHLFRSSLLSSVLSSSATLCAHTDYWLFNIKQIELFMENTQDTNWTNQRSDSIERKTEKLTVKCASARMKKILRNSSLGKAIFISTINVDFAFITLMWLPNRFNYCISSIKNQQLLKNRNRNRNRPTAVEQRDIEQRAHENSGKNFAQKSVADRKACESHTTSIEANQTKEKTKIDNLSDFD